MMPVSTPSPALDHPVSLVFAALFDRIEDRYDRSFLRRLLSFASSRDVNPEEVDEALVADFAEVVLAGASTVRSRWCATR
jgi:hypothetical protein